MDEVGQNDVRRGVQLLILRQNISCCQELVALMADQELVVGVVRVGKNFLVAEVTEVRDALHLGAGVLGNELRQRGHDGCGLETKQQPVASDHVRAPEDKVRGSLERINDGELMRLVVHARRGDGVPNHETCVGLGPQIQDNLAVFLILQRIRKCIEQNTFRFDVIHRLQVLVRFLRPQGFELHHLRRHWRRR